MPLLPLLPVRPAVIPPPDGRHHINHYRVLFIRAVTGQATEYATLDKTFVPGLLDDLVNWIKTVTRQMNGHVTLSAGRTPWSIRVHPRNPRLRSAAITRPFSDVVHL